MFYITELTCTIYTKSKKKNIKNILLHVIFTSKTLINTIDQCKKQYVLLKNALQHVLLQHFLDKITHRTK